MLRVYADRIQGSEVDLSAEEWRHLLTVRRARDGEDVEAIDGRGTLVRCVLRRGEVPKLDVLQVLEPSESGLKLTLAVALVSRDRFEWIVQKLVELGGAGLVPLIAERCEPSAVRQANRHKEQLRWQRIMIEALKQSGRARAPVVSDPVSLLQWVGERPGPFAYLDPGADPSRRLETLVAGDALTLAIGPEGGWSAAEVDAFREAAAVGIRLGPRTLRTETAAVAALAVTQYLAGDLSPPGPGAR